MLNPRDEAPDAVVLVACAASVTISLEMNESGAPLAAPLRPCNADTLVSSGTGSAAAGLAFFGTVAPVPAAPSRASRPAIRKGHGGAQAAGRSSGQHRTPAAQQAPSSSSWSDFSSSGSAGSHAPPADVSMRPYHTIPYHGRQVLREFQDRSGRTRAYRGVAH